MRVTLHKYLENKVVVVVDEAVAEIRVADDGAVLIQMPDADLVLRLTETEAMRLIMAVSNLGAQLAAKRHALEQFEAQLGAKDA